MVMTDKLQLIQITDTHFSAEPDWLLRGVNPRDTLNRVLERAREDFRVSDLVLLTGDLSDDGSDASYREINRLFGNMDTPVLPIPGNHDLPERLSACLDAGNMIHQGYLLFDHWQVIGLNSVRPEHVGGMLSAQQLQWLDARLQAAPDHHTLITLHHPPVEVGSRWMDEIMLASANDLFAILDRHPQVRAVLWGHIHQEYNEDRNGIMLLGTPSTCMQFRPAQDEFEVDTTQPAYRRLDLYPDGKLTTEVIYTEPSPVEPG